MSERSPGEISRKLGVNPDADPDAEISSRVQFVADYLLQSGRKGAVVAVSGGQDSALAGKLVQMAIARLNASTAAAPFRLVCVRLPFGIQRDELDANVSLKFIEPTEVVRVDIRPTVESAIEALAATGEHLSDFDRGNLKARIRMVVQYGIAGHRDLLVVGTDHAAEAITGFFTKFGDGAADILPLAGLTKDQGKRMLRALGAPTRLWMKTPTADLEDERPGLPDEEALGVTYDLIDAYLTGKKAVPRDAAERIEALYFATRHKKHLPVTPSDTWWRPVVGQPSESQ